MKTMFVGLALAAAILWQDSADVEKWIRELGAESFEAREKASAELRKIGAPALEALKKAAAESPDAEVRTRASDLVKELTRPAPPKPAKPAVPQAPGRGASVQVQQVNGDATYTITPNGGTPFTFKKTAAGPVELEYTDADGKLQNAKSDTLEAFLKDHKDLAATYGITKDGIDFDGTKIDFNGNLFKALRGFRAVPFRGFEWEEDEEDPIEGWRNFALGRPGTRAAGATLEAVTDVLRAQLSIPEGQGIVVAKVGEDTVAARAGLRKHDILLEIDGTKVAKAKDVKDLLKKESKSVVLRGGKQVVLGEK